MRAMAALVAILVVAASAAWAQPTDAQRRAALEVHGELAQCSSYFRLVALCIRTRPDVPDAASMAAEYDRLAADFQQLGVQTGLAVGLTTDAVTSRFRMTLEDMVRMTREQPCENFASLRSRWERMCLGYANDPEAAMRRHFR